MLEETPLLTPDQVKGRLLATAVQVAGSSAPGVDAYAAVYAQVGNPTANEGLQPSLWIDPSTGSIDGSQLDGITWDGITWDGITWDGITWDGITWDGITWEAMIEG